MMNTHLILRIGAIGAVVAVLMLVVMVFIPWPFDFEFPGEEVLAGKLVLASADFDRYVAVFRVHLAVDSVFVIGWFVGWLGIASLVRTRIRLVGHVVLVMGLLGAFLDFAENEIMWALIQGHRLDMSPQPGWLIVWRATRQFSYLIPYAAAVMAAMGLWSQKPLDRVTSIVGTLFMALAVLGLYISALSLLADLWFAA